MVAASLGAASAGGLAQHLFRPPGVLPGSPFLSPLHGMLPWSQPPHPWHAVLQQSLLSSDQLTADQLAAAAAAAAAGSAASDRNDVSQVAFTHFRLYFII